MTMVLISNTYENSFKGPDMFVPEGILPAAQDCKTPCSYTKKQEVL